MHVPRSSGVRVTQQNSTIRSNTSALRMRMLKWLVAEVTDRREIYRPIDHPWRRRFHPMSQRMGPGAHCDRARSRRFCVRLSAHKCVIGFFDNGLIGFAFARCFKADASRHVILMSYGTGSVGLNLQFTNYVFLFDRWWNPAVEDQAINRAHRLGQTSTVFVSRVISESTIEGRIAEVLEQKRQLFNDMIEQNGPPPSFGLSEEDVFNLFDIRARPRRLAA